MKHSILFSSAILLACVACDGGNQSGPAATTSTAQTSAATAAKPSAEPQAEYKDADLPVPADFEDDAETNISDKNYKDEINKIEGELGGAENPEKPPAG
jgi:hypothetical protein